MCNLFVGFATGCHLPDSAFLWILAFRPQCFPWLRSLGSQYFGFLVCLFGPKTLSDQVISFGGKILIFWSESNLILCYNWLQCLVSFCPGATSHLDFLAWEWVRPFMICFFALNQLDRFFFPVLAFFFLLYFIDSLTKIPFSFTAQLLKIEPGAESAIDDSLFFPSTFCLQMVCWPTPFTPQRLIFNQCHCSSIAAWGIF